MAYHGYIRLINNYLEFFDSATVLEIGVDKGQTLFPVVNHLSRICRPGTDTGTSNFLYTGIDVKLRTEVRTMASYINEDIYEIPSATGKADKIIGLVDLIEENSLEALPKIIERKKSLKDQLNYCLILVDGDHNYHTVSQELKYALELANDYTLIICDDYGGEGGSVNEYFSDAKDFYSDGINEKVTALVKEKDATDSDRVGVKGAVDEFLEQNQDWAMVRYFADSEPVVLYRKNQENIQMLNHASKRMADQVNLIYHGGGTK